MSTRAGIVLAGGFGERFDDGDKTLAELDGRPLIGHAVDALSPAVDTVVVSCRDAQIENFRAVLDGVVFRPDPTPDEGPLAGLAAGLAAVDAEGVAVTVADRPCVPTELYRSFFESLTGDGVAISADGRVQPVPTVFETGVIRRAVERRRAGGERRLRTVLDDLRVDTIPLESVEDRWGYQVLADVNTTADLERLRRG